MKIKDFLLSGIYNQLTDLELPNGYSLEEELTPRRASELLLDICLPPQERNSQHIAIIEQVLSHMLPAGLDLRKLLQVEISSTKVAFVYLDSVQTNDRSIYYAGRQHNRVPIVIEGDLFRDFWLLVNN